MQHQDDEKDPTAELTGAWGGYIAADPTTYAYATGTNNFAFAIARVHVTHAACAANVETWDEWREIERGDN